MRVLIIEDSHDLRGSLQMLAEGAGCEAMTAEDGESGIEAVFRFRPHLVFVDYLLPGNLNGLDVLKAIKEFDHQILVVILTGMGTEELAVEALRLGASNFLNKPINPRFLAYLVRNYRASHENTEKQARVYGMVRSVHTVLEIPNDGSLVGPTVERVLREIMEIYPEMDTSGMHLGLEEIIRNAIEHGNLELGFDTKAEALAQFRLPELIEERRRDPRYARRRVRVDYRTDQEQFYCLVEDEGPGFDYTSQWDPLSEKGLARLNGRGIFLTRAFYDGVTYFGRGNRVELVKRLGPE